MHIDHTREGAAVAVAPGGRIDSTTAPDLEAHLMALVDGGERLMAVDLSGVSYISSAGLRVLLLLARRIKDARGTLVLCGLNEAVTQVFALAGFIQLFTVRPTREEALQMLRPS